MDAARNHGKAPNEINLSRSLISSQNPCGETLVTSTSEVPSPCGEDFALVLLNRAQCSVEAARTQPVVLRQLQARSQPELRFTGDMLDMDVGPRFFTGEEIEPIAPYSKNRSDSRTLGYVKGPMGRHRATIELSGCGRRTRADSRPERAVR